MVKSHKKWLILFLFLLWIPVTATVTFNFIVDPLWCFSHINRLNEKAVIIDQRQQKTNRLTYGPRNYTALIIGSSRTEPIAEKELAGCRAFNYAAPAMYPDEYADYIKYAKQVNRLPITRVFVGMDFFGTITKKPLDNKSPDTYFAQANEKLYRLKTILNPDVVRVFYRKYKDKPYYYLYDRNDYTLIPKDLSQYNTTKLLQDRLTFFKKHFYQSDVYTYDGKFIEVCEALKSSNPGVEFKVFTTPVTSALFESMVTEGRFNDYCRWLRELVAVFGGIHNFMYLNSITKDVRNYYDADHFFPEIGTLVAHKISGYTDRSVPNDFGVYVTKDNLEQHIDFLRLQAAQILERQRR